MDSWLIPGVLVPPAGQASDVDAAEVEREGGLGRTGTALVAGRVDAGEADGVEVEGVAAGGLAGTGAAGVRVEEHAATIRSPSMGSARRHAEVIGQQ